MDQLGRVKKFWKMKGVGGGVEVVIPDKKSGIKSVLYGVCSDMTEREIKENIKGGEVSDVKHLGRW